MDILIEFQMEEVPARMQPMAETALKQMFETFCNEHTLSYGEFRILSTPRRLALIATNLPEHQADQTVERKGPRTDAPEQAQQGFFTSVNLSPEQCSTLETQKGTFWVAHIHTPGKSLADLVLAFIESALTNFPWPKTMRWGNVPFRWVRPLHSILALVGNTPLTGTLLQIPFVATTWGHRFLGNQTSNTLTSTEDYLNFLSDNFVVANRLDRKNIIATQINRIAQDLKLQLNSDDGLLEEVTGLVEYPTALAGKIDAQFMNLPKELMISVMRTHQRYFTFSLSSGELAPYFGIVANNLKTATDGNDVIHGNEKVLRARLSDGQFYWDTDKTTPLETFAEKLDSIVFHQRLGTLKQKRQRIVHIARFLNQWFGLPQDPLKTAAELCKADLVSGVVGEFPELQGIMGSYYAIHQGKPEIAKAIAEHYKPLGPNDSLPNDLMGITLALADKLDTLVVFFAINEKPTGSKDPFALRRAALGILRLVFDANDTHGKALDVPFDAIIKHILMEYKHTNGLNVDIESVSNEVIIFLMERLKVSFKDQGYRHDVIAAILNTTTSDSFVAVKHKLDILTQFLNLPYADALIGGYMRLWNILRAQKLVPTELDVDPTLLKEPAEQALYKAYQSSGISALMFEKKYEAALRAFTEIKPFIDTFFDTVMVNVEDDVLRQNRLALIVALLQSAKTFAAFEEIMYETKK